MSTRRSFLVLAGVGGLSTLAGVSGCGAPAPPAAPATVPSPTAAPPAPTAPASGARAPAGTPAGTGAAAPGAQPASGATPAAAGAPAFGVDLRPANLAASQKLEAAFPTLVPSMDPHLLGPNARKYDLYETLTALDADANVRPMLATSWRRVDDTTYQFTLRTGLKFHNGDPLTSADVKFSLERAIRTNKPLTTGGVLNTFKSTQVIDPVTVNITTTVPDVLFLKKCTRLAIMPERYYLGLGPDDDARDRAFAAAPVGSGPYQFVSFRPNDTLVLKAFTGHSWRKPILTDLTLRQMGESAARLAGMLTGELHYLSQMPLDTLPRLQSAGAKLLTITKGNTTGAYMNPVAADGTPKPGPMGDRRVRQAINYAVDKERLVKELLGGFTVLEPGQFASQGTYGYDPSLGPYPYDKDRAERLLEDAGFRRDAGGSRFKLTMASSFATPGSTNRQIGEYVQNQLLQVGITVDYTPLTDATIGQDYQLGRRPRPDIWHAGVFTRPYLDPSAALVRFTSTFVTKNFDNKAFDTAFEASEKELDPKAREELLWRAARVLHEDAPWLFLTEGLWIDAAGAKLAGAIANPVEVDQYYDTLYLVN